jgi:hypothetical protein
MKILILLHGNYGNRIAENLAIWSPQDWHINLLELPKALPVIVDEPATFLPAQIPAADLVLHLAETSRTAQLLPEVVRMSGAQAAIAPIDNNVWIPPGLRHQLRRELSVMGVGVVFPEPFCELTEDLVASQLYEQPGQHPILLEFVRHFGRPRLRVILDSDESIAEVIVERGSACGSSQYAAGRLRGIPAVEAVPKGGLICLHYPCLASMQPTRPKDGVENLMHLSGVIFNEELEKAIRNAASPVSE